MLRAEDARLQVPCVVQTPHYVTPLPIGDHYCAMTILLLQTTGIRGCSTAL